MLQYILAQVCFVLFCFVNVQSLLFKLRQIHYAIAYPGGANAARVKPNKIPNECACVHG